MRGIKSVLSAVTVLVVAGVLTAAYQGHQDQKRMQNALILTGNYVGMTEGRIYELGNTISKDGVGTIGDAREVLFWLVCSGRFSSETVEPSAHLALRLVELRGITPKEAVRQIAVMTGSGDPFVACPV